MSSRKYKVKKKTTAVQQDPVKKKTKTSFSAMQRIFLLLLWGAVSVGLYAAVARISFFYSLWIFIIIFMLAFILYFITGIKLSRLHEAGRQDTEECRRLVDRVKILLIIMIPPLFIIIYDFISSTIKMFM